MNTLTTHIINYATGYENAFNNRVTSIESTNETIYAYDLCHIELLSMIDQTNSTHKNICFSYINQILDMYQSGALAHEMESKLIEVKRELLSDTRLFPITESLGNSDNISNNKINIKGELKMNQIYFNVFVTYNDDTKQCGIWAKDIEEAREKAYFKWINADKREVINPETPQNNDEKPITETPENSTVIQNNQTNTYIAYNRSFSSYNEAYEYCIQSDFDSSYIQSETASEYPLSLDLQHFATSTPTTRKLYESNYDSVKIITTSGEHIARIHTSDENEYQHKIFYSSDDHITINDTDIVSVTPIYKKSIITEHGVQKIGIGRHLDFAYTIETTKTDIEVDDINYSNIHSYKCHSIQETLEWFNRMQKMGYHNINIQTNVNYKNEMIISDNSECNIELDINTQYVDELKKDNRQMSEQLEQLYNELNDYKEFIKCYHAEKTFVQFKENKEKKNVS